MLELKEVITQKDLKRFIEFPYALYTGNACWVPPLRMDEMTTLRKDKNPAFEYCRARYWLALRDGETVGRIAAIINDRFVEKWGKRYIRFGWVDFIDDPRVSGLLFGAVEQWAGEEGMEGIHGPLGFCDLDREGMLVEGFDEQSMMITNYNFPYYNTHLERLGYLKDTDWLEYQIKVPDKVPDLLEKISRVVIKKLQLKVIQVKKSKELLPYAEMVFELINDAYSNLYGAVDLSERQIKAYTKQYFSFLKPEYVRIILDAENKLAGFGISMPSLSNAMRKSKGKLIPMGFLHVLRAMKHCDTLDLYLVAVRPDLQAKGVNAVLLAEITRTAIKNGIVLAETGPELETNTKVQSMWKYFDARQHKRRRCYVRKLEQQTASGNAQDGSVQPE